MGDFPPDSRVGFSDEPVKAERMRVLRGPADARCFICFESSPPLFIFCDCNVNTAISIVHHPCMVKWINKSANVQCNLCKKRYIAVKLPRVICWRTTALHAFSFLTQYCVPHMLSVALATIYGVASWHLLGRIEFAQWNQAFLIAWCALVYRRPFIVLSVIALLQLLPWPAMFSGALDGFLVFVACVDRLMAASVLMWRVGVLDAWLIRPPRTVLFPPTMVVPWEETPPPPIPSTLSSTTTTSAAAPAAAPTSKEGVKKVAAFDDYTSTLQEQPPPPADPAC